MVDASSERRETLPFGTGELPLASELLFSWYNPLLARGRTKALALEDIWDLPPANRVDAWADSSAREVAASAISLQFSARAPMTMCREAKGSVRLMMHCDAARWRLVRVLAVAILSCRELPRIPPCAA